mgnify:CR=1 FL=1|tara:strand:- start:322 stop:1470 length:1149 start_codon:yes stop_codon:yes gene_type:complete
MLVIAALPASIASAQVHSYDVPFAEEAPLEVVIMLGPDYDFKEPPFLDANTVVEYFSKPENGAFTPPRLGDVDVDLETPIPHEHHVTVIAGVPPEMDEAERQKVKKKIQRISLRYGIIHVEVISREPASNEGVQEEAVWLRLPFMKIDTMKVVLAKYAKIAVALANSVQNSIPQPRIDVYELPFDDNDPFSDYVASPYHLNDPLASSNRFSRSPTASDESVERTPLKVVDPFARDIAAGYAPQRNFSPFDDDGSSKQSSDPFTATAQATDEFDPFGAGSPPKLTDDQINMQIDRSKRLIEQLRQKAKASIKSEASAGQIRKIISMYVAAEYHTHTEIQKLEFRALESKLDKIRQDIQKRESESVKKAIIEERVRRMLESRNQ